MFECLPRPSLFIHSYEVNTVSLLQPENAEQDSKKLAVSNSPHVGRLLGKLLKKKYPSLHPDIKEISIPFNDLLHWFLWPNFIKLYGKVNHLGF